MNHPLYDRPPRRTRQPFLRAYLRGVLALVLATVLTLQSTRASLYLVRREVLIACQRTLGPCEINQRLLERFAYFPGDFTEFGFAEQFVALLADLFTYPPVAAFLVLGALLALGLERRTSAARRQVY